MTRLSLFTLFFIGSVGCLKVQKKSEGVPDPVLATASHPAAPTEMRAEPTVPRTRLVIDEYQNLVTDTVWNYDDIVFTRNARILTKNFNLTIHAQTLTVENGAFILNFETGTRAPLEVAGRNGGTTRIQSQKMEGTLEVIINAEHGGHGRGGWTDIPYVTGGFYGMPYVRPGCLPNGGADGGTGGVIDLVAEDARNFNFISHMGSGEGGLVGPVIETRVEFLSPSERERFKRPTDPCMLPALPGNPGRPGRLCTKWTTDERPVCVTQ